MNIFSNIYCFPKKIFIANHSLNEVYVLMNLIKYLLYETQPGEDETIGSTAIFTIKSSVSNYLLIAFM